MAVQWSQQNQPNHQFQQTQSFPQQTSYDQGQQYQQPYYQQPQQFHQSGQYAQNQPSQYQQLAQQTPHNQTYQQHGQYTHFDQGSHYQPHQQTVQQHPHSQQQYPQYQQHYPQPPQQYPQPQQAYPQAQQNAYSGQQQQYAQQYSPQQYQPQNSHNEQQNSNHHVAYNQPQQLSQISPVNGQVATLSQATSCFNCGAPNHIAQNCPEPKREVPAGALDRRYANPSKRVKPNGTVVTKYLPPAQPGQPQTYSHSYGHGYPPSNYGTNGQIQYQGSSAPAGYTPSYDQTQQQAWEQYYQWQAYQQNHQQHPQAQVQPSHQHAPYSSPSHQLTHQNTMYVNNFQQHNQAASQPYYSKTSFNQHEQQDVQTPSSRPVGIAPHDAQTVHGSPNKSQETKSPSERQQSTSSASMEPPSTPRSPRDASSSYDQEEDDFSSLDVPDLPRGMSQAIKNSYLPNTVVSTPVSLISMPLPANFVVADALYPIPPPGPENAERCQSKYLRDATLDTICANIQTSRYWKDHQDDTVFFSMSDDDAIASLDQILSQVANRYARGEAYEDPSRQTRSQSRSVSMKQDSIDVLTNLEKLERDIAEMKEKMRKKSLAKAEQMSPDSADQNSPSNARTAVKLEEDLPQSSSINGKVEIEQNTEDILAALGVTGSPKPTEGSHIINDARQDNVQQKWEKESRQQQQGVPQGEYPVYSPNHGFPPPPPPPPPSLGCPSLPEKTDGDPGFLDWSQANDCAFDINSANGGNGLYRMGPDGETNSPSESRYENNTGRKRSYNHRSTSSGEDDIPARRQEDDVTPKLKRRQPKVAAAYSRRW